MKLKTWLQPIDTTSITNVKVIDDVTGQKYYGFIESIPDNMLVKNITYVSNLEHGTLYIILK